MLLSFPILIAYSFLSKNFYPEARYRGVSVLSGFFIAVLYSFIQLFFFPAYYLTPYSFLPNFLHSFLFDICIPLAVCLLFIYGLLKKFTHKSYELYYILLGFFVIYFPARTFNTNTVLTWYELFIKPLMFVSMIYVSKNLIVVLYRYFASAKELFAPKIHFAIKVAFVLCFILCFAYPSVVEALYMLGITPFCIIPMALAYCAGMIYGSSVAGKKLFL